MTRLITFIFVDARLFIRWSFLGQAWSPFLLTISPCFSLMVSKYVKYAFWVMNVSCVDGWCHWPVRSVLRKVCHLSRIVSRRSKPNRSIHAEEQWSSGELNLSDYPVILRHCWAIQRFPRDLDHRLLEEICVSQSNAQGCLLFTINIPRFVASLLTFRTIQARTGRSSQYCLGLGKTKGQWYVAMQI